MNARIEVWVGIASFCCSVGFLPKVVEDMLVRSAQLAEFAKVVAVRLRCDGTVEVEFGCLDGLVGKVRDWEIAGGGIDTAAFLVGEGCRWHAAILLILLAPCDLLLLSLRSPSGCLFLLIVGDLWWRYSRGWLAAYDGFVILVDPCRSNGYASLMQLDVWVVDGSQLFCGFDCKGSSLSWWLVAIEGMMRAFAWMWHCQGYFRAWNMVGAKCWD
jgi:hypothetical protein